MTDRALRAAPDPDDFSDLYEKIEQSTPQSSNHGPWDPQVDGPGSEIRGRVVAVREINSEWGTKPILTLDTETGERDVRAFHTMLRSLLEENPPTQDARILIRYEGTGTTGKGYEYHRYSVAVDRTLEVPNDESWVDVFNGTTTRDRASAPPRPSQGPTPQLNELPDSDLPF